ncbi:PREDICTED: pituitary tumor-transforming gene 1 protein-interacting protein-like isoform X1 [Acropora digitifera]|uniref:pituitary tumor-transforming gene 1 protein-interacting protein-like isoform X1 n=1 Tax=Acropora digitifera TaxID=70779 RepID=UPI00077AD5D5|nr:PREDICTED: pituitary tumor-transforming gene 1 protein-interacting protein-like isoform X1 [Acropora digitifera]
MDNSTVLDSLVASIFHNRPECMTPDFVRPCFKNTSIWCWSSFSFHSADCSQQSGKACKDCIEVSGCVYCEPTKQCLNGSIVKNTLNKHCEGQEWKAGQCIVSGKVLIIALSVAGIVVLVTVFCCIYCCCCRRKRGNGKPDKEEAKFRREREERSKRHEDREQERREKREEIRKKYGLNQQPV